MLTKKINNLFEKDPDISGIVVTHGTSSLEETAYWLNLTVKSEKPVVVTGTMRPPSAMGTESDNNLLGSIILAGSKEAQGMGVTVMLNDEINAAREVTKQNSYRIQTFGTRELGFLGYLDSDLKPMFYRRPTRKHTHQTPFDVNDMDTLPQVDVLYSYEGASDLQARALVDAEIPGIVVGSMGPGAVGEQVNNVLLDARKKGIIVVITTRAGAGRIIRTSVYENEGIVAGDNLSPQKARILLKLALTITTDPEEIQKMFNVY
jgi:L-asparaginase